MINNKTLTNQRQQLIMERLYHTLTYEGSTIALMGGYYFIGYGLVLMILTILAMIYTPYLIKTLINLKKWKWIIAFAIMISAPFIMKLFVSKNYAYKSVWHSISLFMFYLFCWILKFSVQNWIEKIKYSELKFDD
ncbi:MAG: hypothetical protein K8S23_06515 [Candidatus Cloacimonetes bacterium]|nr:hypothetical protein [Candidatus Cloacimonadota bacterium]